MIRLSKDACEAEAEVPTPVVIAFPPVVGAETANSTDVPKAQQELAMLHRALTQCGLVQSHSKERE
ncbi:MAG: hypothetical protein AAGD07_14290 [Planctomycetota bacterium]